MGIIEHSEGWRDVALWNPHGNEKMGADRFVCVESAAIDEVLLQPNATWIATMGLVPKLRRQFCGMTVADGFLIQPAHSSHSARDQLYSNLVWPFSITTHVAVINST